MSPLLRPSPATLFVWDPCHSVVQGLSNLGVPQNHLEGMSNHRVLHPTPVSDSVGLGHDTRTYISFFFFFLKISNRLLGGTLLLLVWETHFKSHSSHRHLLFFVDVICKDDAKCSFFYCSVLFSPFPCR